MSSASKSMAIHATRDYVIRREFDFGEGDPYNRTLIDRAERRLKNLNYFKIRENHQPARLVGRPRRARCRDHRSAHRRHQFLRRLFGTTDGGWASQARASATSMAPGIDVKASITFGQYARSINLSASEPYFLGTRIAAGVELFGRQSDPTIYQSYGSATYGGPSCSARRSPNNSACNGATRSTIRTSRWRRTAAASPRRCRSSRLRRLAPPGSRKPVPPPPSARSTTTRARPAESRSQLSQDLAGLGGDVQFLRTTSDTRYYHQINSDVVAMVRGQGGYITGWGGQQAPLMNSSSAARPWCADLRPMALARAT